MKYIPLIIFNVSAVLGFICGFVMVVNDFMYSDILSRISVCLHDNEYIKISDKQEKSWAFWGKWTGRFFLVWVISGIAVWVTM